MNKQELEKFKDQLRVERQRIVSGIDHIERETLNKSQRDASGDLSGYSYHIADQATDNYDTEFSLDLASAEQQRLNEIEAAIKRVDEGVYGVCEECSKAISMKRLKAVPYARLCIKCQEGLEQQKKQ